MQKKLYILSGPPASKDEDAKFICGFAALKGKKAVCGSDTLKIFCKITGACARLKPESLIPENLPEYKVLGLDFASEGILTLNAAFSDLKIGAKKGRTLSKLMLEADEIIFITGGAQNKNYYADFCKRTNVLPREEIIDKIILFLIKAKKTALKQNFISG